MNRCDDPMIKPQTESVSANRGPANTAADGTDLGKMPLGPKPGSNTEYLVHRQATTLPGAQPPHLWPTLSSAGGITWITPAKGLGIW